MTYFKCVTVDKFGCIVETEHCTIGLAIFEGLRRKAQAHTDVTITSEHTAPAIIQPGAGTDLHRKPKAKSRYKHQPLSIMEAI